MVELSELHDCEKSHGKIVAISVDKFGITRCDYCNKIVNYKEFFKKQYPELWKKSNGDEIG